MKTSFKFTHLDEIFRWKVVLLIDIWKFHLKSLPTMKSGQILIKRACAQSLESFSPQYKNLNPFFASLIFYPPVPLKREGMRWWFVEGGCMEPNLQISQIENKLDETCVGPLGDLFEMEENLTHSPLSVNWRFGIWFFFSLFVLIFVFGVRRSYWIRIVKLIGMQNAALCGGTGDEMEKGWLDQGNFGILKRGRNAGFFLFFSLSLFFLFLCFKRFEFKTKRHSTTKIIIIFYRIKNVFTNWYTNSLNAWFLFLKH